MRDLISRQAAIDAFMAEHPDGKDSPRISWALNVLEDLPSAQPEQHEIGYYECVNVMLKMWNNNVLTNGEYKHIMDKLNAHWAERREE